MGAVGAIVAWRAVAGVLAGGGVGVALGPGAAGVAGAGVLQVAQQPRLAGRTLTVEAADPVVAGAAVETAVLQTVVLVGLAVGPDVAVDTDALVAALGVLAGAVVLAGVAQRALVHVLAAVAALPVIRALAAVRVDAVDTG